jgi:hypothetical protein
MAPMTGSNDNAEGRRQNLHQWKGKDTDRDDEKPIS